MPADARNATELEEAVAAITEHYGRLDVAVHNAGVAYWEPVTEVTEQRRDDTFDTNLKAAFILTRAVLPRMLAVQSGQLIYVATRLAKEPVARYAAYCAAKAGLLVFADVVTKEVLSQGIRVTTVLPGLVDTAFSEIPHGKPRDQRPPHEQMLRPEEVAEQIVHVMASPANAWVKELLVYPARL